MDESLQQLEDELKSLRLRRPSPSLVDRLTTELAAETDEIAAPPVRRYTTSTNLGSWKWLGWRAAGVAAALAVVALLGVMLLKPQPPAAAPPTRLAAADAAPVKRAEPTVPPDQYQPVAATNVLYDLKDEGLVDAEGPTPARQVRARFVDTYTWKNPRDNSSLKWSVPRDEIRVIPASLH
jgi:hypothetical protein